MDVAAVESTTLAMVGYDKSNGLLQLGFRSGAVYEYGGVPEAVHEALMEAPSKGGYFNRFIRGRFPYWLASRGDGSGAWRER